MANLSNLARCNKFNPNLVIIFIDFFQLIQITFVAERKMSLEDLIENLQQFKEQNRFYGEFQYIIFKSQISYRVKDFVYDKNCRFKSLRHYLIKFRIDQRKIKIGKKPQVPNDNLWLTKAL